MHTHTQQRQGLQHYNLPTQDEDDDSFFQSSRAVATAMVGKKSKTNTHREFIYVVKRKYDASGINK